MFSSWFGGGGAAEEEAYSDEEDEGPRVENVRLFTDKDFESFLSLVDSPHSDSWSVYSGPQHDEFFLPDQIRVERRPCPRGKYLDVFRVTSLMSIKKKKKNDAESDHECALRVARNLLGVLMDSAYRKQWDVRCSANGSLSRLNGHHSVGFYCGIAPSPVAPRDFCTLKSFRMFPPVPQTKNDPNADDFSFPFSLDHVFDQAVVVNRSIRWPSYPPQQGVVRGRSIRTGNIVRIIKGGGGGEKNAFPNIRLSSEHEDETFVALIYCSHSDLKGWLPGPVVTYATTVGAPDLMKRLSQAADGYEEWLLKEGRQHACDPKHPDNVPAATPVVHYGPERKY